MSLRINEDCEELCRRRMCYEEEILGKPTTTVERCVRVCRGRRLFSATSPRP